MNVHEVMKPVAVSSHTQRLMRWAPRCAPSESLEGALEAMRMHRLDWLPVTNTNGRLLGTLQRKAVEAALSQPQRQRRPRLRRAPTSGSRTDLAFYVELL